MKFLSRAFVAVLLLTVSALSALSDAKTPAVPTVRVTFDLGPYRGWWQVVPTNGPAITGTCSGTPRCRPWLALAEGGYSLSFSDEPQTETVAFQVAATGVALARPSRLATAADHTILLGPLKPVTFALNGYQGPWMLGKWRDALNNGFFGTGGGSQTIDLVPFTTYSLDIGATTSDRFQVDDAGKVLIIDDRGAVRVTSDAAGAVRLEAQPIDVAFYPKAAGRSFRWVLHPTAWGNGRRVIEGPEIVRLVQGSTFDLSDTKPDNSGKSPPTIATGKGCNMVTQRVTTPSGTLFAVPLIPSCESTP